MKFNKLVDVLLSEGGFNAPIGTKMPVKKPAKNHGNMNPLFNDNPGPAAYSGFKGDSRNPAMFTAILKLPRKKIKKRRA